MIIEGITWIGFIDRLEQTSSGYRVVDYKTSASAMTKKEAGDSIQLAFYAGAITTDGGDVIQAQLWYPRVAAQTVTVRDLDLGRLDELSEEMRTMTGSIRAEDWAPKVGEHCQRCDYRLSCPAWPEGRGAFLP